VRFFAKNRLPLFREPRFSARSPVLFSENQPEGPDAGRRLNLEFDAAQVAPGPPGAGRKNRQFLDRPTEPRYCFSEMATSLARASDWRPRGRRLGARPAGSGCAAKRRVEL